MKKWITVVACWMSCQVFAQPADVIFSPSIKTVQLFPTGNPGGYPILNLNGGDRLSLFFDDLDANAKNYSYTYQLCNADWSPVILNQMDYISGFTQVRLANYKYSSFALTRYTHYEAFIPDRDCMPTRSGNYLLKVFLDRDTSQLVFTRRFLVLQTEATVGASILQPINQMLFNTHQKVQFTVNTGTLRISNPFDQIKIVILQNNRWDNAIHDIKPSFMNGSVYRYNNEEDCLFPAGKEWRWLDLQSFRYQSDRIATANYGKTSTDIYLKPDPDRSHMIYTFFNDKNGIYYIQTTESINPYWQTDYASVHFTFVPPDKRALLGKDVYIIGQLTNNGMDDSARMTYNDEKGVYQTTLFLKQGYYYYCYVTVDRNDPHGRASFEFTEGNNMETENDYTILVYFRELGGRADKLVAVTKLNSTTGRPGF